MRQFYNKALVTLLCLLVTSFVIGYLCVNKSYSHLRLLPADESGLNWHIETATDFPKGGLSTIKINEDRSNLDFDFTISKKYEFPFISAEILFDDDTGKNALVDLSSYNTISFAAKCAPDNVLFLAVLTFDESISTRENTLTYRGPSKYFHCSENRSHIEVDLTRLEIPSWWFDMFKIDIASQGYKLDKVPKIIFGNSTKSPAEITSKVQLSEITLNGRDWSYLYLLGALLVVGWGSFALWFFKRLFVVLANELKDKIQRDRPLIAYQQLSIEPHKDKEKSAIFRYMATEYANPDLDVETIVAAIGVNRNKINDILKLELGYTFNAYLNKLRITEAARLLSEKEDASVAEIAYVVGYKNVSYFNKLFKEEYNCTPKAFKTLRNK